MTTRAPAVLSKSIVYNQPISGESKLCLSFRILSSLANSVSIRQSLQISCEIKGKIVKCNGGGGGGGGVCVSVSKICVDSPISENYHLKW